MVSERAWATGHKNEKKDRGSQFALVRSKAIAFVDGQGKRGSACFSFYGIHPSVENEERAVGQFAW